MAGNLYNDIPAMQLAWFPHADQLKTAKDRCSIEKLALSFFAAQ